MNKNLQGDTHSRNSLQRLSKVTRVIFDLCLVLFMVFSTNVYAQTMRTFNGTVLDSQGEPVIGAGVVQKDNPSNGVVTDLDGNFSVKVPKGTTVCFSAVGFKTQELLLTNQKNIRIILKEDKTALDEVVVTAFGSSQRKESVTGAIQVVNAKDLEVPSANLSTSFAGRLAGVISFQRSGEPGRNGANFYIRGISTLSGVTSPLIVMDGVEISAADLNAIDPEIIASFSILKDATATAMYGTRGANGVMIIRTKSGDDLDRPVIGMRLESYVNTPTKIPEFVNGVDYMKIYNEAIENQGGGLVPYSDTRIEGTEKGYNPYVFPNVDWYDEIFKNYAFNQKVNFNIRGGTSKITYFMNAALNHETGMLKNNSSKYYSYDNNIDYYKLAFQNNIDFHLSETSTIGLHLNAQLNTYTGPSKSVNNIFGSIMANNPVDFPISFPDRHDGDWVHWGILSGGNTQGATNPMALATQGYQDSFESVAIINLDFTQKLDFITPGLSFKALASFKNWSHTSRSRTQSAINRYYVAGYTGDPESGYEYTLTPLAEPNNSVLNTNTGTNGDRRYYIQSYFNYDRQFGKHYVNSMLLFNANEYNTNNAGNKLIASLPKRKMGFAFRASYDYDHRYMFEVNAGYNGSENFAKGHRWGFFPSVSVGWNIANESFWSDLKPIVNTFKLRGSYGLVGNDQIGGGRYIYLAQVDLNGSPAYKTGYGGQNDSYKGPTYNRYQNNDITWEIGHKANIGVDLSLYNSLNLTFEYFQEHRTNIFQQKSSIPNYFGTAKSKIYGNLAEVKNRGFEASADFIKRINSDWFVSFKGTFTYAKNKIMKYDEGAGLPPALKHVGKQLNTWFGYEADGLYIDYADIENNPTSTLGNIAIAPGDIKYIDQPDANGEYDGQITSDDRIPLGYPTIPEIIYGFGPSVQYRNIDFSFFVQGAAHTSLMMAGFAPFGTQYNRNVLSWIKDDYWSVNNQNPNAAYPRVTKYDNNNNTQKSSYWLRDASFLKLKNVEVGYNFKYARIYLSAINLLTLSPFKHWDPEMGGGAGLKYPTQRTFNAGLQVTF